MSQSTLRNLLHEYMNNHWKDNVVLPFTQTVENIAAYDFLCVENMAENILHPTICTNRTRHKWPLGRFMPCTWSDCTIISCALAHTEAEG